ncbi:MAG: hypothetical protein ABF370_18805 [Verrucomicrobiales bacterium]
MSSDALTSLDKLPQVLTDKLGRLRRRVTLWFTVDGLIRVIGVAFALIALDLLIDWFFRMDRAQRGIMLVIMIGVLLWVAWRHLVRPLKAKLTDEALCLEMEKHGEYSEELISALEFSHTDWSKQPNVAPGLVKESIAKGLAVSEELSLDGVLRHGRFVTNLCFLAVLLLGSVVLGVACVKTNTMSTWLNRNVLLGNAAWPQDYYFDVANAEGQTLRIPRGDDYQLTAVVREGYRYLPESAKVEFRSGAGRRLELMDRADDGKSFGHQMISVTEPLEFRLSTKKIKSEWYRIALQQRPEINSIRLMTKPPEYTGTAIQELPPGEGPYYVLKGSSLGLKGVADKPLAKANIVSGETKWLLQIRENAFAGEVAADELASGSYTVELEDLEGLDTREPLRFKLRLKDDETPQIKARLHGVSGMVVARARLPFKATLSDDFSLEEVKLSWQWREDTSEANETTGEHTPAGAANELGKPAMELDEAFDIESLDIPVGSRLSLRFQASDNDLVSGPKVGKSTELIVRVVSEAEMRDDLLRREKAQRELLAGIVDTQDLLLTECQGLLAETRSVGDLTSEQRSQVVRSQKKQKLLVKNILPIVERLRGMILEIGNNKLEEKDGVLQERLRERIIEPLDDLTRNELALASEYLERVRRSKEIEERKVLFTAAVTNQQSALKQLRAILVHMVKNESYQQAVNLLYEIQKSQQDLRTRTDTEKAKLLENVLEPKQPKP